ncbi:MAG: lytic murein transglycosylase [Proteobacteria bacterium]|nr:lytic murein transglycosylase [Pseudomonadota bacterium]MBU1739461.1 lytic murein transglycosylase [Pseudomonadota bacterium]
MSSGPSAAAEAEKPLAADLVKDGQTINLNSPRYQELFAELQVKHNFSRRELEKLFRGVTIRRRVLELMDTQWEARPWYDYYPRFITAKNISEGRKNLDKFKDILARIEKDLGVEKEIVVAIWGIESQYGKHKGAFNMFRTLNTMFDAYPRRSKFYRDQLIHYLLLCRENNVDPLSITGSYGGAFGQTQFIPSSFREYAVDYDQDGRRDVWASIPDILASIANYLHRYNWEAGSPVYQDLGPVLKGEELEAAYKKGRKGLVNWQVVAKIQGIDLPQPPENRDLTIVGLELNGGGMRYLAGYPNFQAITKWNNSNRYAMAVTELAARFRDQ